MLIGLRNIENVSCGQQTAVYSTRFGNSRKIHIGFSAGRFEFMARPYGIVPRDIVEEAAWPALRGQIFIEASTIMLRLLRGNILSSKDSYKTVLTRKNFRSDADWLKVQQAAQELHKLQELPQSISIEPRYTFEELKIIPQDWPREGLELIVGSHDRNAQRLFNEILPVKVFNLSITKPEIIEQTHKVMYDWFHEAGGEWQRSYMPRTVMVFLSDDANLNEEENNQKAHTQAKKALSAYWSALQGTIDPQKVQNAANNALVGSVRAVAQQIVERFHRQDRLMLWFDLRNIR